MEVNGVPIIEAPAGGSQSTTIVGENFDTFLTLLTTQLQNQDPLSPLDTEEFTSQLTSFSQVEQAISTNTKLDALIGLQGASQLNAGVAYIGKIAEAPGDQIILDNGKGRIGYELPLEASQTTITILNQFGSVVASFPGSTNAGQHVFEWDGTDLVGDELPDGIYDVLVTPLDSEGNTLASTTTTFGKVSGVETQNGKVTLVIGSLSVDLDDIVSVHDAESFLGDEAGDS